MVPSDLNNFKFLQRKANKKIAYAAMGLSS